MNNQLKASTRSGIDPFYAMECLREAQTLTDAGKDVLHLSVGQPGEQVPLAVRESVAAKLLDHVEGYTDARGIAPLREAIAAHYASQYGLTISPDRVFVTVGSSAAYLMSLLAAFDVGDKVALAAPYYPATPSVLRGLGLEPVILPATINDNFQPTLELLKAAGQGIKGLVIASPSNPAGTVIAPEVLAELSAYCASHGIRIISDEIYHGIAYDGAKTETILRLNDDAIVTNSFSKYYLMPGYRLGWAVMPELLKRPMESLLQNFFISPPTLSQLTALEVMQHRPRLDTIVQGYDINRKLLLSALHEAGIERLSPAQGAFYIYADVSHLTNDSANWCRRLLHEAHICAVPGMDFDKQNGHRFVRFSYCATHERIAQAGERLKGWIAGQKAA